MIAIGERIRKRGALIYIYIYIYINIYLYIYIYIWGTGDGKGRPRGETETGMRTKAVRRTTVEQARGGRGQEHR